MESNEINQYEYECIWSLTMLVKKYQVGRKQTHQPHLDFRLLLTGKCTLCITSIPRCVEPCHLLTVTLINDIISGDTPIAPPFNTINRPSTVKT